MINKKALTKEERRISTLLGRQWRKSSVHNQPRKKDASQVTKVLGSSAKGREGCQPNPCAQRIRNRHVRRCPVEENRSQGAVSDTYLMVALIACLSVFSPNIRLERGEACGTSIYDGW